MVRQAACHATGAAANPAPFAAEAVPPNLDTSGGRLPVPICGVCHFWIRVMPAVGVALLALVLPLALTWIAVGDTFPPWTGQALALSCLLDSTVVPLALVLSASRSAAFRISDVGCDWIAFQCRSEAWSHLLAQAHGTSAARDSLLQWLRAEPEEVAPPVRVAQEPGPPPTAVAPSVALPVELDVLDVSAATAFRQESFRTRNSVAVLLLLQLPLWMFLIPVAPVSSFLLLGLMGLALEGISRGDRLWIRLAREFFFALGTLYALLMGVMLTHAWEQPEALGFALLTLVPMRLCAMAWSRLDQSLQRGARPGLQRAPSWSHRAANDFKGCRGVALALVDLLANLLLVLGIVAYLALCLFKPQLGAMGGAVSGLALLLKKALRWFVREGYGNLRHASRQLLVAGAGEVLQEAGPYVLYLRSFADDDLKLSVPDAHGSLPVEVEGSSFQVRFEEMVTGMLRKCGPVVGIGRPGEAIRELGAHREYVPDDAWQQAVRELLAGCRMVALVPGLSEGVLLEIAMVREEARDRCVFVFPPAEHHEARLRWDSLFGALGCPLPYPQEGRPLYVALRPEGLLLVTGRKTDTWHYEMGLHEVLSRYFPVGEPDGPSSLGRVEALLDRGCAWLERRLETSRGWRLGIATAMVLLATVQPLRWALTGPH